MRLRERVLATRTAVGFIAIGISGVVEAFGYAVLPRDLRR